MFWLMVTGDPNTALVLDIIFFILALTFGVMLFYFRWRMGAWWDIARSKIVVIAVGRDKLARIITPRLKKGHFLDLGKYGKLLVDPATVYKVLNVPGNQGLVISYLPYALSLDVEKLAAANMITEARKRRIEEGKVKVRGGEVEAKKEKEKVIDDEGNIREIETTKYNAYISEPIQVTIEDIENWQMRSTNPILIDVAVEEEARAKYGDEKKTMMYIKMMATLSFIMMIILFVVAVIK